MTSRAIAVCSWSLRPEHPADLVSAVEAVGCGAVQLALSPIVAGEAPWLDAFARLRDAEIIVASGMMALAGEDYSTLDSIARTGGVRPDATWDANRDHAERVADLAAEHEIDLVTFHAGFIPESADDPERAKLVDRLATIADIFGARERYVGFETGQETAATLDELLDELDAPNAGVNFDPANMILYGKGDPVAALERLASRVVQVHVKDARPTETPGTWGCEVAVGDGAVDWPAFLRVADAIDPPVCFVVEREAGEERADDVRRALALLREVVA